MELRNHPLMSIQGRRNWPPTWVWIGGRPNKEPKGEVGILKAVRWSCRPPIRADRCFLIMEYEEALYMGCLLFDDRAFCEQLFTELHDHFGETIQRIGGLDLNRAL